MYVSVCPSARTVARPSVCAERQVRKELDSHGLLPVCLKSSKTLGRDHAEALSTSNGTINTVLNLSSAQNNVRVPRLPLWPPRAWLPPLRPADRCRHRRMRLARDRCHTCPVCLPRYGACMASGYRC